MQFWSRMQQITNLKRIKSTIRRQNGRHHRIFVEKKIFIMKSLQNIVKNVPKVLPGDAMDVTIEFLVKK